MAGNSAGSPPHFCTPLPKCPAPRPPSVQPRAPVQLWSCRAARPSPPHLGFPSQLPALCPHPRPELALRLPSPGSPSPSLRDFLSSPSLASSFSHCALNPDSSRGLRLFHSSGSHLSPICRSVPRTVSCPPPASPLARPLQSVIFPSRWSLLRFLPLWSNLGLLLLLSGLTSDVLNRRPMPAPPPGVRPWSFSRGLTSRPPSVAQPQVSLLRPDLRSSG